jgi:hypothetical protein
MIRSDRYLHLGLSAGLASDLTGQLVMGAAGFVRRTSTARGVPSDEHPVLLDALGEAETRENVTLGDVRTGNTTVVKSDASCAM